MAWPEHRPDPDGHTHHGPGTTEKGDTMSKRARGTSDAVSILHRRFVDGDPEMKEVLEEARLGAKIARRIYELRTEQGLSQAQLAELLGTTAPGVSRLENHEYDGYKLSTLQKLADALGHDLEVRFVPKKTAAPATDARDGKETAPRKRSRLQPVSGGD
jgi:ribosome-binding protein aMBF1 (putative translation factor)